MEFLTKKQRARALVISIEYLAIIILGVVLICLRGLDGLKPPYILNLGVDLLGMSMGYVLFVCCNIDVQRAESDNRYFRYLLNVTFFGLFTDLVAWLVDGIPQFRWVNILNNTFYYMCAPLDAYFFWKYVIHILGEGGHVRKLVTKFMRILLYIAIGVRVLNIFSGFYFSVDELGIYHRGPIYPVSMVIAYITSGLTIALLIRERKKLERYRIVVLFLYVFAPLLSAVFTAFVYGVSISQGVIMLVMLLMYCVVNIMQGREKAVADRDLMMATAIQAGVLPHDFPPFPERNEFDLYASMNPAKEVGGDFYDFYFTDDDHLALVMADVSGKGVPAALFMMITKALIKTRLQSGETPGQTLFNVNNQLLRDSKLEMFVTVWLAVLDIRTGEGVAVNAGHEHPLLRKGSGEYEFVKYRHSPAVVTIEDLNFAEHEFKLSPGDSFFVYTDGVAEATSSSKELFGEERILRSLNRVPDASPEELLQNIRADIDAFTAGAGQFDDITMLSFVYHGKNGGKT